jgi:hypothetical protein
VNSGDAPRKRERCEPVVAPRTTRRAGQLTPRSASSMAP